MFVTNWISTTKIQKISEITNFFRHYFLSRTEVYNDNYYDGVIQSFQGAGYTKEYINNLIWGVYINDNQLDKCPLSKFTKDILEQIGII